MITAPTLLSHLTRIWIKCFFKICGNESVLFFVQLPRNVALFMKLLKGKHIIYKTLHKPSSHSLPLQRSASSWLPVPFFLVATLLWQTHRYAHYGGCLRIWWDQHPPNFRVTSVYHLFICRSPTLTLSPSSSLSFFPFYWFCLYCVVVCVCVFISKNSLPVETCLQGG